MDRGEFTIPAVENPGDPVEIPLELEATFEQVGQQRLTVTVCDSFSDPSLSDSIDLNVNVVDRDVRLLLLAQRPRYEMRYLLEDAESRSQTVTVPCIPGRWRLAALG